MADARARRSTVPSDNFFAEMLLKDLGARFGGRRHDGGRRGASCARTMRGARRRPRGRRRLGPLARGPHVSRARSSACSTAMRRPAQSRAFEASLPVAGRTRHARASACAAPPPQARCRGKTGTLYGVIAPWRATARTRDGHTIAFAFLMNGVDVWRARAAGPHGGRDRALLTAAARASRAANALSGVGAARAARAGPPRRARRRRGARPSRASSPALSPATR